MTKKKPTAETQATHWFDRNYFWGAASVFFALLIAAAAIMMRDPNMFLWIAFPIGIFLSHTVIKGLHWPRGIIILFAVVIGCGLWLFSALLNPTTYIYLLPGRGLGANTIQAPRESILRRVFIVEQKGRGVLHNVEVILHDNTQKDQTSIDHVETYDEVDCSKSELKDVQPKHFWFKPSTPWNEDYTITIKSRESVLFERILVKGIALAASSNAQINPPSPPKVNAQHGDAPLPVEMGKVEFAIRVTTSEGNTVFTCQDPSLIGHAEWQNDQIQPCLHHNADLPSFEAGLDPKPFVLLFPSGMFDMTPPLSPNVSSHPETRTDTRRLSEWQRSQLRQTLNLYPKQNVLIVFVGGVSTRRYAQDFADVFHVSKWNVEGPISLTIKSSQETISDVQLITWEGDFSHPREMLVNILDTFKRAGMKGRDRFICSLKRRDVLVLLVGNKSPDEENPLDHPPYSLSEIDNLVEHF